jgi:hypothetical protein
MDGFGFSTAQNANLCLRDSTGANRTVYLGANAVAATTPVDLSGTNACNTSGSGAGSSSPTQQGLNINHTGSGNWEVRLVSVDNPFDFSGTFYTAGSQFNSAQPVSLESDDSFDLSNSLIKTEMHTWPGGNDGINFNLATNANLCMWGAGFSGPIFVNGSPASLPLDLSGTDACNGGSGSTADGSTDGGSTSGGSTGGDSTAKSNSPGHYLAMMRGNDSQTTMANSLREGMVGFMKRYVWRELEPSQGNYDFSEIQSDLDFVHSQGLQLIIMIEDKTFVDEKPVAGYLQGSQYMRPNHGYSASSTGYTALRWNSFVHARYKALMTALGNRFDSHPALEGIIPGEETAPSVDDIHLDQTGYTPEKYRDNIIDSLIHTSNVFPTSRVFWYFNFLPRNQSYIGEIAQAIRGRNMVMGNPDVMPDNGAITRLVYPYYYENQGKIDLFGQVEPACYMHPHADTSYPTYYWTMPELYSYARNNLKVNYMFWMRFPGSPGTYNWTHALPVIKNNQDFNQ